MQRILAAILPCLLLLGYVVSGGNSAARPPGSWDGEVRVHGALRAMLHEGQIGAMVTLDTMLPNPHLYAVGALADLSGEISVVGGKVYLSYPSGAEDTRTETTSQSTAGAALLVAAEVSVWHSVTTETSIRFEKLDEAIGKLAVSAGMNLDERFPFLLEGVFEDLQWHVIDGKRLAAGEASHQDHLAASIQARLERAPATLIGFYSAGDQGVFTHMGSKTHIHCVLDSPLASGHVDSVTIPAGTVVKFPAALSAADR